MRESIPVVCEWCGETFSWPKPRKGMSLPKTCGATCRYRRAKSRKPVDRGCSIEGCAKPWFSRDFCQMHYARWLRHGDPATRLQRSVEDFPVVGGRVPLKGGGFALVDSEDAELVGQYLWRLSPNGYVVTSHRDKPGNLTLHRLLMGDEGETVDHINHDKTDNRRSNLRRATQAQNNAWTRRGPGAQQPYKGVRRSNGRWRATVYVSGERRHLGTFDTAEEAAIAYDAALLELWGDFAATNERLGLLRREAS